MQQRLTRGMQTALLTLLIVMLAAVPGSGYDFQAAFPQVEGTLQLKGLQEPVEVWRDRNGVPHIYARHAADLLLAQGFVHAQDRFWQMDVTRHFVTGRMSELFGRRLLSTDRWMRSLGLSRSLEADLTVNGAEVVELLSRYADGVNAYIQTQRLQQTLLGYQVLRLTRNNYQPAFWQPSNAILIGKAFAWILSANLGDEIRRGTLLQSLTPDQIDELMPSYPSDHPIISQPGSDHNRTTQTPTAPQNNALPPLPSASLPLLTALSQQLNSLALLQEGIGSNNWVIGGTHTATGEPLLANDPHLGVQIPSLWYEMGLHCLPKTDACPFDVVGFSYPGTPGLLIGYNDKIAWGVTNVAPDTMDLYIEKTNPENPNQYEVNGRWVEMEQVTETIRLPGGTTEPVTIRFTRHGPVISDRVIAAPHLESQQFRQQFGVEPPQSYAIALRWTVFDPAPVPRALLNLLKAQNWQDFRTALQDFNYPSQNFIYADVEGNIGYQMPGKIPIRARGEGRLPVPGWTDEYEWTGYIPFEALPSLYNPPQGYIASANNAVVDASYPYLIATDWDTGFRAQRIVDLIEQAPAPLTMESMQQMQGDTHNLNAAALVPTLLQIELSDPQLQSTRNLLLNWDFQETAESPEAALFQVFWNALVKQTFEDDLPAGQSVGVGSRGAEVVRRLVQQPESDWWDDRRTSTRETRDDIFRRAIAQAVDELGRTLGKSPTHWQWGNLHSTTFRELSFGQSRIRPIEQLFNRGPFPTPGSNLTINATGWFGQSYQTRYFPSMRMIVDLSNLDHSLSINTTGQSGHPKHPNYDDQISPWLALQFHPMHGSRRAVEANTETRLQLVPAQPDTD